MEGIWQAHTCKISDSHSGVDEDSSLLRCYAPPTGTELPTF
jgi:hypothetical protein